MAETKFNDIYEGKVANWSVPFQRTAAFPLDRSCIFDSISDAEAYAKGDGSDSRGLGKTSYIGQTITVFADSIVNLYKINADRTIELVGKDSSAKSATNYTDAVSKSNDMEIGQLIKVANPETIESPDGSSQTFASGFYIVEGKGKISLLATSTGSDNEMATLKGRVDGLETKVGQEAYDDESGHHDSTGLINKVEVINNKLPDLENKIEEVKINNVPLEISQKSVNITYNNDALFTGTAEGDNLVINDGDASAPTSQAIVNLVKEVKVHLDKSISLIPKFKIEVVDSLPVLDISYETVYLVKSSPDKTKATDEENLYTEYIWIHPAGESPKWEKLGDQHFNLNGYAKTEEVKNLINELNPGEYIPSVDEFNGKLINKVSVVDGKLIINTVNLNDIIANVDISADKVVVDNSGEAKTYLSGKLASMDEEINRISGVASTAGSTANSAKGLADENARKLEALIDQDSDTSVRNIANNEITNVLTDKNYATKDLATADQYNPESGEVTVPGKQGLMSREFATKLNNLQPMSNDEINKLLNISEPQVPTV